MVLPLYAGLRVPQGYTRGFNTGLWYDKFFMFWRNDWTVEEDGKKRWIQEVCKVPVGDRVLLEEAVSRLTSLVRALDGECRCFGTDWRFVTGLGRPHPVENGFAWHHTLGVPFLPGSSVKGIVRTWAERFGDSQDSDKIVRIFGPEGEGIDKHVGSVIFFDALPIEPVKLEADVMTPHYSVYYQQERPENPPGDWYDPVPIPFLTVAPRQVFLFALAPRRPEDEQSRADCHLVMEWLTKALEYIGAGAKTAVGYGRFAPDDEATNKIFRRRPISEISEISLTDGLAEMPTEEKRNEAVSPIRKEMEDDGYSSNPDRFMEFLTNKWLKKLQDEQVPLNTKQEIAALLKDWYMTYKSDQWQKPNKKNAVKIAEIKKFLPENA
ncbi:MAG TPA: type III-B CRISPR module RAMP protein Cmr6 [Syntrophomonadaceae bacterium]|nr:type III-B CRISPR module RAMP protein Cmr6 [Syntrophomonadaceae bacterium]